MRSLTKYPEAISDKHVRLREQHDSAEKRTADAKPKRFKEYMTRRQNAHERTKEGQ